MSKNNAESLTVTDKLLLAAHALETSNRPEFTAEDLVVSAWKHFPRAFGLRGYNDAETGVPLYPDSNRVFAEIMGSKPIRKRGLLTKVGKKLYSLTDLGRNRARTLLESSGSSPGQRLGGKATLDRVTQSRLERILKSKAVQKFESGEENRITFHDACVFWGITPRSDAIELQGAFANLEGIISIVGDALTSGASELRTRRGDFSTNTVDILKGVHSLLKNKFQDEIETISKRTDQRK